MTNSTEEEKKNDQSEQEQSQREQQNGKKQSTDDSFEVSDPLGLLSRSKHIAAAAADAAAECLQDKKRKRRHMVSEEQLRKERLEANRKSAAESRKRKKMLIEELQQTVAYLREENDMLKRENAMLKMNQGLPPSIGIGSGNINGNTTANDNGNIIDTLKGVTSVSDQQQTTFPFTDIGSLPHALSHGHGNFNQTVPISHTQEILRQYQQQLGNLGTAESMATTTGQFNTQAHALLRVSFV